MSSPVCESPTTPMLKQYQAIKTRHPDCILFFRLGDFYEMFYEDATIAARELDLTLTARGKGTSNHVPMCGFPHHAAENYIGRLIKAGHKIAICEQMEDPSVAKGIVKRDVIRIITAGTYLDESANTSRYLLALTPDGNRVGVAFIDPVQGTIMTNEWVLETTTLIDFIAKLPIQECVFPEKSRDQINSILNHPSLRAKNITVSAYPDWAFTPAIANQTLRGHFDVSNLHGFGLEGLPLAIRATGALLEYLRSMNRQPLRHIDKIQIYSDADFLIISPAARKGLEIDTLIKTLDHTQTALGRRMFSRWILYPLKNPSTIAERQHAVTALSADTPLRHHLQKILKAIPDLEKNISRLSCGYTHARDLLATRHTLTLIPELSSMLNDIAREHPLFKVEDIPGLRVLLETAVNPDIPLTKPEGKIIREGYHAELDELRNLQANGRQWLRDFQAAEIRRTGINSLKVGFNKIFGYYLEISKANADKTPPDYIRKQTLVNAERYITEELKNHEEKILSAESRVLNIEHQLVMALREEILHNAPVLHDLCEQLATLDALYSLATLAQHPGYIQPNVDESAIIDIRGGRHPVVEKNLEGDFIANDTLLDEEDNHLMILTGPNMAGKSTYIRQTAILVIMAQAGSHIPAIRARVGVADKIFTRIGAHDDISRGQSTFMVEMNETADILHNLTPRSLLILDEIGRGTSTYDGLSLAWALAEHLAATKARALFATHFHEITALAEHHPGVKNYNVAVKEWKDKIIFLHKIVPGGTDDSYGIYVARLAGIPSTVIRRSREILSRLERRDNIRQCLGGTSTETPADLCETPVSSSGRLIIEELRGLDINTLTPLAALQQLQEWKERSSDG
jgi:DNA mismatch repair protein MutS